MHSQGRQCAGIPAFADIRNGVLKAFFARGFRKLSVLYRLQKLTPILIAGVFGLALWLLWHELRQFRLRRPTTVA
jgi:hypothetical protein